MHMQQQMSQSDLLPATLFEIKLRSAFGKEPLVFTTVQPDEGAAAEYGRAMLERHDEFDFAAIWQGRGLRAQSEPPLYFKSSARSMLAVQAAAVNVIEAIPAAVLEMMRLIAVEG